MICTFSLKASKPTIYFDFKPRGGSSEDISEKTMIKLQPATMDQKNVNLKVEIKRLC